MSNLKIDYCPKCGREEKVDKNHKLKLCSICFMRAADLQALEELRASQLIDWDTTIKAIKKEAKWTQATLAFWLHISPATISDIRHGKQVMEKETFSRLQERFSNLIKYKNLAKENIFSRTPGIGSAQMRTQSG